MSQLTAQQALVKIKTMYLKGKDNMMESYKENAIEYDAEVKLIGYKVPFDAGTVLLRYLGSKSEHVRPRIIDVACGTGLVGLGLRSNGFQGIIHGIDGCEEMINIARTKSVYDDLFREYIEPDKSFKTLNDVKYDGLICVGAFFEDHLDPKVLPNLADLLAPGGVMVYSSRLSHDNYEYLRDLENEERKLTHLGILENLDVVKTHHGVNWNANDDTKYDDVIADEKLSELNIYCLRKIKA